MAQSSVEIDLAAGAPGEPFWFSTDRRVSRDRRRPSATDEAGPDAVCGRALANWIDSERRARLIVTRELDVMWMNEAARGLRDEGEAFEMCDGRLTPRSAIIVGLVAAARPEEAGCAVVPGEGGRHWVAWAREVCAAPDALIGLTLQRARSEIRFQALIENHLLTPSEGRIIEMLLAGAETGRVAQALDISIETLRTHLKHAYQKLGVRSRGELFAEALSFVGP
ncbi:LuxR family transcriptional regulator [uncultured Brevundimonas sp.]|uniref:helix-turn-helix transcriptional regulator n=1 Tax=uncultured Brevundimonas sp. TaxID=213418 RepID=UPI0025E12754|nr:LuxR family transcriptional regulator [uncultured Brevundimonas sp.]